MTLQQTISFPKFSGTRCLMMPFIQGEPESVPSEYAAYNDIVASVFLKRGDRGYLTIDESPVIAGAAHRGARAKYNRALHTEAGVVANVMGWGTPSTGWGSPTPTYNPPASTPGWGSPIPSPVPSIGWGSPSSVWGGRHLVTLDRDVRILLANNLNGSCALWDAVHEETTYDGDIGHLAEEYPYTTATIMGAGEVHEIGIFTPHESLPVTSSFDRQFLRIVGSGVHGREPYFTVNPLVSP